MQGLQWIIHDTHRVQTRPEVKLDDGGPAITLKWLQKENVAGEEVCTSGLK